MIAKTGLRKQVGSFLGPVRLRRHLPLRNDLQAQVPHLVELCFHVSCLTAARRNGKGRSVRSRVERNRMAFRHPLERNTSRVLLPFHSDSAA